MSNNNPFLASNEGGSDIEPVPAGLHPAILVAIYDVGWQYNEKFEKSSKKVIFSFEIPGLPPVEITRKDNSKAKLPRALAIKYTNSLHEKSALRAGLESWFGRPLTEDQVKKGVDLTKLLRYGVTLQVMHEAKRDGGTTAVVRNLLPLPKAQWPKTATQPKLFSISEVKSVEEFEALDMPKWIKKMAGESSEYERILKKQGRGGSGEQSSRAAAPAGAASQRSGPPDDERSPFDGDGSSSDGAAETGDEFDDVPF